MKKRTWELWSRGCSVFAPKQAWIRCELNGLPLGVKHSERGPKVLQAFIDDDDLQEMTVVSANIGFVRTYQKRRLDAP